MNEQELELQQMRAETTCFEAEAAERAARARMYEGLTKLFDAVTRWVERQK